MRRAIWKECIAGLVMLAVLTLMAPTPAHAAAWGPGGPAAAASGGWSWIAALWEQVGSMIFGGGHGSRTSDRGSLTRKSVPGVPGAAGADTGGMSPQDDNGSMINPDG